jgi:hypothetical protein
VVEAVCAQVLPAVEVERITHREDVRLVPRMSIRGAGGTCNYATEEEGMLVLVTIGSPGRSQADPYAAYKRQPMYRRNQRDIGGLGDAAFTSGDFSQIVVAKKGNRVIAVSSFFDYDRGSHRIRGALLSREQVTAIARAVVGKL